jgi:polyferredoxin
MNSEENLRDELLRQNGESAQKADEHRDKILAQDEARVTRMRRLAKLMWVLVVVCLVGAFMVRPLFPEAVELKPQLVPLFITLFQGILLIAIIFTISFYIRSRTLAMRQIQARLAGIEEQLKRMTEKD